MKKISKLPTFKKSGQLCQLHSFLISVLVYFWFLTVFLKPPDVSTYFYFFGKFPQDQQKLGQTCRVSTMRVLATVKTFTLRHFYPWNHFHLGTILTLTYYFLSSVPFFYEKTVQVAHFFFSVLGYFWFLNSFFETYAGFNIFLGLF